MTVAALPCESRCSVSFDAARVSTPRECQHGTTSKGVTASSCQFELVISVVTRNGSCFGAYFRGPSPAPLALRKQMAGNSARLFIERPGCFCITGQSAAMGVPVLACRSALVGLQPLKGG